MTVTELYARDSGFRSLIAHWVKDKRCPFVMADYLRDNDLHKQAEWAEWAAWQTRPNLNDQHTRITTGIYPYKTDTRYYWFFSTLDQSNCVQVKETLFINEMHYSNTIEEALLYLLDCNYTLIK